MLIRTALGALSASALVVAGVSSPAAAHDKDDDSDKVSVIVCKHFEDGNDDEFDLAVSTDEDDDDTTLEDGQCETFELKFDDNLITVEEDVDEDDWDVTFTAFGDVEDTDENATEVEIEFDEDVDDAEVVVIVENEEA